MAKNMGEPTRVKLSTSMGDIIVALSDLTPGHRDNFVKNVEDGAYDGVLFHRVIKDFMVQTGDPTSKTAGKGEMLGAGDHGEQIPSEIVFPKLYHKRGAIAAARTADAINPEKKSSGSQFYIVTGKICNESELARIEKSMQIKQQQAVFDSLAREHRAEIMNLRRNRDTLGLQTLQNKLIEETENSVKGKLFKFSPEQKSAYTTIGGTPFLDGEYTVFGEIVEGMDIIDKIQAVATDKNDRPNDDIKIIKATILK